MGKVVFISCLLSTICVDDDEILTSGLYNMYVGNMALDADHIVPNTQALHKNLVHKPEYIKMSKLYLVCIYDGVKQFISSILTLLKYFHFLLFQQVDIKSNPSYKKIIIFLQIQCNNIIFNHE